METKGKTDREGRGKMKAVKSGHSFNLFSEDEVSGISLEKTGGRVEVNGAVYPLYRGAAFADSQKVDDLLDEKGEMPIRTYRVREPDKER